MQKQSKNFLPKIDDNTFYRMMNNQRMDWRKLLFSFAKQFIATTKANGDKTSGVTCFVLDDTTIEKTGKTMEFIGKVYDHITHLYPLGFKLFLLGFWDGKNLVAADCSLHREKGKKNTCGMSKKELKSQFRKERDSKSTSKKRVKELDMKKGDVAVSMLKRVVKKGL